MKKWLEKIKAWHIVITAVAATIALVGPWVIKLDSRWVHAEEQFKTNMEIQQSIKGLNVRLDRKIVEDKFDEAQSNKIEFELKYGVDPTKWTDEQKKLYEMILIVYKKTEIEYNNLNKEIQ